MRPRLGKWFVVLALALATGSHWYLLQSIAWVGMAVDFSRSEPLPIALQKTFDGQHPCELCKVVGEGMQAEKKAEMEKRQFKFDFFCEPVVRFVDLPAPRVLIVPQFPSITDYSEAPPVPPPRFA